MSSQDLTSRDCGFYLDLTYRDSWGCLNVVEVESVFFSFSGSQEGKEGCLLGFLPPAFAWEMTQSCMVHGGFEI